MTQIYRLHYAPDNASLIVRMVLQQLDVPYETLLVDRRQQAHKKPEYLRLNPNGLIPVLETPSGPIFETAAILLWLTETHGALAPQPGHPERAAFLKWLFFASNTVHAEMRILFHPSVYIGPRTADQQALRNGVSARVQTHLQVLDAMAAGKPGFFGNPQPSVLDFYVCAMLRWLALYPQQEDRSWFRLSDTPQLDSLAQRLQNLPAVLCATQAEGLGPTPFAAPSYATPPEGSAT